MILAKLGRMAYVNTLPVDWGLVKSSLGKLAHIVRGTPTTLNALLANGELDISPVSLVAAAENAEDWLVLDHICIGSRGAVGSVILHSDVPVEELEGHQVSVTSASATASKLVRVLFSHHWKVCVRFVPDTEPGSARLLIGDAALMAAHSKSGFVYDLGEIWKDYSGKSFVFGVWCPRKEFVRRHPRQTEALYYALAASYALGRSEFPKIIAEAVKVTGLEKRLIEEYFPKLMYQFDTRLWEGSAMFLELIGFRPDCLRTYRPPEVPHPQKICALDIVPIPIGI